MCKILSLILEETVEAKEIETKSVFEWMGEREAGCLLGRGFGVGERQKKLNEALDFFPPRAMIRSYVEVKGEIIVKEEIA